MANKYTKEQKEFLITNNYMRTAKDLTDMFNEKFGTNLTTTNIKNFRSNNKIKSGLTGRFEKGQISWNKGKTWDEFMSKEGQANSRKTTFKKGHTPVNSDTVGTEKWKSSHSNRDDEGFLYVKIQDKKGRFNWKQKHRLIWEEVYGPIPKGYKLIFLDGDRHHIELNNLALVSNSQMLIMNKNNLIYEEKELTKIGINIAKVKDKVNKVKNERL